MPTPPLTDAHRQEILDAAPGCRYKKDIASKLGLNERTLRSRIHSLGITDDEIRAAMFGPGPGVAGQGSGRPDGPAEPVPEIVGAGPKVDPGVEEIRRSAERRFRAKAERAVQKEHQRVTFPHGPVALFFCGDQHAGAEGSDVGRMFAEQELINRTPAAYVWQMGDVVDNFVIGKLIAENMNPSLPVFEQWALAKHYLDGFGDRLVAYTGGNHEAWTLKLSGIDYRRDICPDGVLYDGDEIRATVGVGPHRFRVWARHRWQGHSMYNPTHPMERAARFDSARFDLYVGAHVHKGAMAREFVLDGERKLALLSGTYKAHDSYARAIGFPANDGSTAVGVVLHDDGSYFACADLEAIRRYMVAVYRG